jgi:hypothetical protein|tara:strand:- start:643 stop:861 length:219 start_codon:yes stop_codon:yes gene_type:complete
MSRYGFITSSTVFGFSFSYHISFIEMYFKHNKASQSDLCKLPAFCKKAQKAVNSLRQLLAALEYGFMEYEIQ